MAKRKLLLIGGTGTISTEITKRMAKDPSWDVTILNRGKRQIAIPENVEVLHGDMNNDEAGVKQLLQDRCWDCVGEFTVFDPKQAERDVRLFAGKTKQFIFISTCMAYNTPPQTPFITEGMIQKNPYSEYARNKIACEQVFLKAFREQNFPITIVRPSHTYCERHLPFSLESPKGCWPVLKRMLEGKPVIQPGDGSSLWVITMSEDFAKGFCGLVGNPHAIGEAVHITTDEVLTWDQMAQQVADELGVPYKPYYIPTDVIAALAPQAGEGMNGDKRHSVIYDNSRLKKLVPDYTATITWREGVRRSIDYLMEHKELQVEDPEFDAWCDQLIDIYDQALQKAKAVCTYLK